MIEKYITNLVNEFHKNNFEEIDSLNNCEKMVALYSFYHYFFPVIFLGSLSANIALRNLSKALSSI